MNAQEEIHRFVLSEGLSASDPNARATALAEFASSARDIEEYFGHGPLLGAFADVTITEMLVNGPGEIWVERFGRLERWPHSFSSEESLRRYARRLLAAKGRKVDHLSPFADCALDDGSRLHVAIPPIAPTGTHLSLRRFRTEGWTLSGLAAAGALSPRAAELLASLVVVGKNVFVSGGTGTGKTSLLGALIREVPHTQRVIALEDVREIRADHPHLLQLEARPPNQDGEGAIPLRRLLKESLRMRPDRLVVGECRGPEALDLLMALHTGHAGSMGTIHANSAREALHRLEMLALLAAENLRESAVKTILAGAIQVIVQLERRDGKRRVASIHELKGVDGGIYLLKELKAE